MTFAVFIFSWLVDFFLLMGVGQLHPGRVRIINVLSAASINALYVVFTLQDWFAPMVSPIFGCVAIILAGIVAFGCGVSGIRSCGMFLLLRFAVAGVLQPGWILRPWPLLMASLLVLFLSILGFPERDGYMVPVELSYGTNHMTLTALRDTGNTLQDPLTGKPVLILSADVAQRLTGLTLQQLRSPVEAVGTIPGLRLIPYRSIGGEGLLLALRLQKIRVGRQAGSGIVAFAPEVLSKEGKFQALTGGAL